MIRISVEFPGGRPERLCWVSRVPCIGESIGDSGKDWEVVNVRHRLDADDVYHVSALVRVRGQAVNKDYKRAMLLLKNSHDDWAMSLNDEDEEFVRHMIRQAEMRRSDG